MPLRFSEIAALRNAYTPQFRSETPQSLLPQQADQRFRADQAERQRKADAEMLGARLGTQVSLKRQEIAAKQGAAKEKDAADFLKEVTEYSRLGDTTKLDAAKARAPQYGFVIEDERIPSATILDANNNEVKSPEKQIYRLKRPGTGEQVEWDINEIRERNQADVERVYSEHTQMARPEDLNAATQSFELARSLGLPADEAMKVVPIEDMKSRADRESRERGQIMQLGQSAHQHAQSLAERRSEHDDRIALAKGAQDLARDRAEGVEGRAEENQAFRWMNEARKVTTAYNTKGKREIDESASKLLRLLDTTNILVPGAKLEKSHVIAIGEMAKAAQGGDSRISDRDRAAVEGSWDIVNHVTGILSRKTQGQLQEQDVKNFEEALARIIEHNEQTQHEAFDAMVRYRPNGNPVGEKVFDRFIYGEFGTQDWYNEATKAYGLPTLSKGDIAADPKDAPPPTEEVPSDDDIDALLGGP